jgi:hypothetical protein
MTASARGWKYSWSSRDKPEDLGDDHRRVAVGELGDELGRAAVDEAVDHLVDDRHDELLVPVGEHPLAERLRDERPQALVLRLVHPDERVRTHRHAHDLADAPRAERDVVAHDLRVEVVRVDLVHAVAVERDRRLGPQPVEVRIGVPQVARDPRELRHRLEGSVQRHRHRATPIADIRVRY